jgi:putative transposase
MSKGLFRHYGRGHLHFITFSCYRRLPLLRSVRARKVLVTILDEMRHRYGLPLAGYAVMPERLRRLLDVGAST